MTEIDINNIDLENSYFHFTKRSNIESIEKEGLRARIGDASQMVNDKARVCLSKGGKGILGIINSFIHEFKNLRICDIPEGYREYFHIMDFEDTEIVKESLVYDALTRRLKDEVYLIVDSEEGVDFEKEDINGLGAEYDIKGKENHDISQDTIKQLTFPNGNSAFAIVNYLYEKLLRKNPESKKIIKEMLSDLDGMHEYLNERDR